jgi:hypothetical protein
LQNIFLKNKFFRHDGRRRALESASMNHRTSILPVMATFKRQTIKEDTESCPHNYIHPALPGNWLFPVLWPMALFAKFLIRNLRADIHLDLPRHMQRSLVESFVASYGKCTLILGISICKLLFENVLIPPSRGETIRPAQFLTRNPDYRQPHHVKALTCFSGPRNTLSRSTKV